MYKKRGYPDQILLTAFNKVWSKTQEELLEPAQKIEDNRIRLITTFNQRNPPMKQILTKYDIWLGKTRKNVNSRDIQTVRRKVKNLKQLLVKGKIKTPSKALGYLTICNKPCETSPYMDINNTITSSSNMSYKIQGKFHCQSRNSLCNAMLNLLQTICW